MYSVGIDAHDGVYALCILDENGRRVKERVVRGGAGDVASALGELGASFRVCYEASLGYGVLHDALAPVAAEVQVAHPAHLRAIFRAKRKNDRLDARKLAAALYMGQVPRVHVPSREVREWRVMIEHRRRLVDKRTAAKNGVRAVLRSHGVPMARGRRLWSRAGMAWLRSFSLLSPMATLRRDQLLLQVGQLDAQIAAAEEMLDAWAARRPGVALLRTIPGVGPRTAEAVMAYVDDAHRFGRTSRAASYFGIVPCLDESAGVKRYGHITRDGPATVRKMVVEASWHAIRRSPAMKAFFERVKGGKKERRGVALVATAHRLLKIMVAMLKSGEVWREEEPVKAKAAA
jgi:transposase